MKGVYTLETEFTDVYNILPFKVSVKYLFLTLRSITVWYKLINSVINTWEANKFKESDMTMVYSKFIQQNP